MITAICRCGRPVTYDAARPGERPKNVKHLDVPGQPAGCPK